MTDVQPWREALEWLERSRDSTSPSVAKLHAITLLARLDALTAQTEALNAENASLNAENRDLLEQWSARGAQIEELEHDRDKWREETEVQRKEAAVWQEIAERRDADAAREHDACEGWSLRSEKMERERDAAYEREIELIVQRDDLQRELHLARLTGDDRE